MFGVCLVPCSCRHMCAIVSSGQRAAQPSRVSRWLDPWIRHRTNAPGPTPWLPGKVRSQAGPQLVPWGHFLKQTNIVVRTHTHTCTYAPQKTACKGIIYQQGKRPYPSNRAISETMLISTAMCNSRVTPVRMLVNVWSRNLIGTQKKQSPSIFGDTFFSSKKNFVVVLLGVWKHSLP